jgi:O-antigen ligase
MAGLAATAVLGVAGKRAFFVTVGFALIAGFLVALSADSATVIRERIQSVFQPEASVSGFDSSVIRIALAMTALSMFLAHPLTGVGLKGFAHALPYYAPAGLPLAVETGPGQVLTPIASPHSTYLSLLSETGILGGVAVVGWLMTSWWVTYHWNRTQTNVDVVRRQLGATLMSTIAAIAVFNLFGEMNASSAVPLTVLLALGCGLRGADAGRSIRA